MKNLIIVILVSLNLFLIGCYGCYNGISFEEEMTNCKTVADLDKLKRRCFLSWGQLEKIEVKKQEFRKIYIKENPNLSDTIKDCILNKQIITGMTKEQVLVSWGAPNDINKNVGVWGVNEQWVYGQITRGNVNFLYFENGELTSWQDY